MNTQQLFCPTCGAANAVHEITCFACGKALDLLIEDDHHKAPSQGSHPSLSSTSTELLHGRYQLLSVVGQGGFATVHRAQDTQQHKIVAIKAISLRTLKPQEVIDATDTYNREIQFGTSLKHPSLPRVYDHFMDQENWYIVVDFIDGQTLDTYMQTRAHYRLPLREVLEIGVQLCDVLEYLHTQHPPIIFRDVKPDNIMRTTSGRVYLVDFGIARHYRPGLRRDTQALGSPGYAAPEQYGSAQTTERSDIYSLGATLQALITGVNPLDADQETKDDEVKATLPPGLLDLFERLLQRDPLERPNSVKNVRKSLEQIALDNGIHLTTVKPSALKKNRNRNASIAPPPLLRPTSVASQRSRVSAAVAQKASSGWRRFLLIATVLISVGGIAQASGFFSFLFPSDPPAPMTIAPPEHQQLIIDQGYESLYSLDPVNASSTLEKQLTSMLFAGLVQLNREMEIEPQLAKSWVRSEDGLSWTFTLREDLTFSDGSPLTANDVVRSIDRALEPKEQSYTVSYYLTDTIADARKRLSGEILTLVGKSLVAQDEQTIVIKTSRPIAFLPEALLCPCASVVKTSLADESLGKYEESLAEYASGPFVLTTDESILPGEIKLLPNEEYYGQDTRLRSVTFVDSSNEEPLTGLPGWYSNEDTNSTQKTPLLWINYYGMNYLTPPFNNIKIRQAFALALDKDSIAEYVGDTAIPTNHLIPQGQDGYLTTLKGPDGTTNTGGNQQLAQNLLQEGMKEEGLEKMPPIKLAYAGSGNGIVEYSIQQWLEVLEVKIMGQQMDYTSFAEALDGTRNNPVGLQMWFSGWIADYPDPQNWTSQHFGKDTPHNLVNYGQNKNRAIAKEQQQVQTLLQEADTQRYPRLPLYQEAEQALVNDVAWLPLYQQQQETEVDQRLKNYEPTAMGIVAPEDWAEIYLMK